MVVVDTAGITSLPATRVLLRILRHKNNEIYPIVVYSSITDEYSREIGSQPLEAEWRRLPAIDSNDAAKAYLQSCLASVRGIGKDTGGPDRSLKRQASGDLAAGQGRKISRTSAGGEAGQVAATAASSLLVPAENNQDERAVHQPISHFPSRIREAYRAAGPWRYVSVLEKTARERDSLREKVLVARTETGHYQIEAAALQSQVNALEDEKKQLLEANQSLVNTIAHERRIAIQSSTANDQLRRDYHEATSRAMRLQFEKSAAQAETRKIGKAAADQKAKFQAEIEQLKKKLVARDDQIKKATEE